MALATTQAQLVHSRIPTAESLLPLALPASSNPTDELQRAGESPSWNQGIPLHRIHSFLELYPTETVLAVLWSECPCLRFIDS